MPQEKIAIDPALGRIAFPSVLRRPLRRRACALPIITASAPRWAAASTSAKSDRATRRRLSKYPRSKGRRFKRRSTPIVAALTDDTQFDGGVVEIEKPVSAAASDYHHLSGVVNVPEGKRITVRAVDEHRPVVLLGGDLEIKGGANAELELNGLLIIGGALRLPTSGNQLRTLRLAHCALPPGAAAPAVVAESPDVHIEIDRSLLGAIQAADDARVCLTNSIVDAGDETNVAYAGVGGQQPGAPLVAVNTTIIGRVHTLTMELASNTIFFASSTTETPARAEMLQEGCVRFCYVPPGSRLPRQFECQPETQEDAATVRPIFTSLRYGDAGYCQLSVHCSEKIKTRRGRWGRDRRLSRPLPAAACRQSARAARRISTLQPGSRYFHGQLTLKNENRWENHE